MNQAAARMWDVGGTRYASLVSAMSNMLLEWYCLMMLGYLDMYYISIVALVLVFWVGDYF